MRDDTVTASTCLEQLNNHKPLHIAITADDGDVWHGVLIAGVYYTDVSNAGGLYTIMDPNCGDDDGVDDDLVTVGVSSSVIRNGSGFNYVTDYGYTFDTWVRTRY